MYFGLIIELSLFVIFSQNRIFSLSIHIQTWFSQWRLMGEEGKNESPVFFRTKYRQSRVGVNTVWNHSNESAFYPSDVLTIVYGEAGIDT